MTSPLPPVGTPPSITQVPPGTPAQAWFIIPEGEAGQIINAMSTALNTLNFNRGVGSVFRSWLQSAQDILGIAQQKQTAWTTIHATDPSAVQFLLNQGLTPYKTQAQAGQQAGLQNQAVNPNASSGASGSDWQHLLVRTAEFILGALLVAIGINALIVRSKAGQTTISLAEGAVTRSPSRSSSPKASKPATGSVKMDRSGNVWRMDEMGVWEPR